MTDELLLRESRAVLAGKARTFNLASLLLPRRVRSDAALVYAFCRLVDDTADLAEDADAAAAELDALAFEVRGLRPPRPIVAALREVSRRRGLPLSAALELIAGVRGDLGCVRVADDAELLRYCYRVAGTVGLMMCSVLGVTSADATSHAVDLGVAMQLTNIARDVREDAERGRVYLPAARLLAAGADPEEVARGRADPARVARVVGEILDVAERYYTSADAGIRDIPARCRAAILVAARVYRAIGGRLREKGCDAMGGRVVLPWHGLILCGGRAALESLRPAMLGLTGRPVPDPVLHAPLAGLPGTRA